MPRIKAPPHASTLSLTGVAVTFASYSPTAHTYFDSKNIAQLKAEISRCGGQYISSVDLCNHLVATEDQFNRQLLRVTEALRNPNVTIVNYDWLAASLQSTKPVATDLYLLGTKGGGGGDVDAESDADNPLTPQKLKKPSKRPRQGDEEDDNDEDPVITKKAKPSFPATATDEPRKDAPAPKLAKIHVPVDELCNNANQYRVYVDDNGIPYDATLSKSDSTVNNNKFYRMQLLVHSNSGLSHCWCRWGRVGDNGLSMMFGDGTLGSAILEFEKKFKSKSGNKWANRDLPQSSSKYTYIEISYEDSDDKEVTSTKQSTPRKELVTKEQSSTVSKLPPSVQRLMSLIFDLQLFNSTMASLDYDASRMPLGKLSKKTLLKGYEVLKDLANLIADPDTSKLLGIPYGQAIQEKSNQYFSLVPHVVSRKSVPVLNDMDLIKREIQLLETLTDMQLANEIMKSATVDKYKQEKLHILDRQYQGLGMREMTPLDSASDEFQEIGLYLHYSVGGTHGVNYQVQDIFRIEREGEAGRLDTSPYANLGNKSDRRLLWHGSRCSNFGGILSQGLRIAPPEAPASGYMFGKGVYLADMSSKSAGYCNTYSSGGTGLLLLCEAELGKPPLRLINSDYEAGDRAKKSGSISTWGIGKTAPQRWKDASCIHTSLKGVQMPDVVSMPPGPSNEPNAYLLYNEYIVYDIAQIKLRYLLRVQMT
ncbi:hypothetical protein A1O3_04594 [Capronia epimyces CBS 606.96]|uniref:Poly [ADP-ribose] polymerase n=1 Tax=Capronia epimyces CBS 606.96 TaxID=1182542 RepID=W9Y535_9EURO|nr:uncharacterized protein A1O3_04594 [Capronia epimyces CBS 606.96]EXJ87633.1 hypothetical protein A1O3_04594 [Capronia epimyces CBS 606.96]